MPAPDKNVVFVMRILMAFIAALLLQLPVNSAALSADSAKFAQSLKSALYRNTKTRNDEVSVDQCSINIKTYLNKQCSSVTTQANISINSTINLSEVDFNNSFVSSGADFDKVELLFNRSTFAKMAIIANNIRNNLSSGVARADEQALRLSSEYVKQQLGAYGIKSHEEIRNCANNISTEMDPFVVSIYVRPGLGESTLGKLEEYAHNQCH